MFSMTRKRWVGISSALTMALVLVLMLTTMASADSPILHRVSAGGPDVCAGFGLPPGCDANFSLVAIQRADGTVSGQYIDRFPQGQGIHAVINCLRVEGNVAWISGVITQGRLDGYGYDPIGKAFSNKIVDNGTSANQPVDQISFSALEGDPIGTGFDATSCDDLQAPVVPLFDAPQGQVKVR